MNTIKKQELKIKLASAIEESLFFSMVNCTTVTDPVNLLAEEKYGIKEFCDPLFEGEFPGQNDYPNEIWLLIKEKIKT